MTRDEATDALVKFALRCQKDPLTFVQRAFPWGEGPLQGYEGPDEWQTSVLTAMRDHIASGESFDKVFRFAAASGNGIGKSSLVAWILIWAMATMSDTRGVVTANTEVQLVTKTFAELQKWYNVCIYKDWFEKKSMSLSSTQEGHDKTWRIDAIAWSENRPEAMAGTHNNGKRIIVIFDEASAIADSIWDAIEGAMTDKNTQIFWLVFGNPTRSTGRFFDCFNRFGHRWIHKNIDSRTAKASNKEQIQAWIEDYGEDSDFVKVHVRGVFPSASSMQFIPRDVADASAKHKLSFIPYTRMTAIIGVDVARFGDDSSVITVRFGQDARSFGQKLYRNLDGWQLGSKVAEVHNELRKQGVQKIIINVDVGGVGASPCDWLKNNGYPCNEINFGSGASKPRFKNLRAEMWFRCLEWMKAGGCIEDSEDLITDLTSVEFSYTAGKNELILERKEDMKKRGLRSPDCFVAGTLVLTPIGQVPIESLKVGDDVVTPVGIRKIIKTWEVETDKITTVRFSNGSVLSGKGAHKVFTYDKGWVRLDMLSLVNENESITLWSLIKWNVLTSLFTEVKPSAFKQQVSIISREGTERIKRRGFFTDAFGLTTSALFLKAIRCITKTVIGLITAWKIWRLSKKLNITECTCSNGCRNPNTEREPLKVWQRQESLQRHGIHQRKESSGTLKTQSQFGKTRRCLSAFASIVGRSMKHTSRLGLSSAQEHASEISITEKTRHLLANALSAVMSSALTSIGLKNAVPVTVQTSYEPQCKKLVYNLTLSSDNIYYANGILVENCADSLCLTFAVLTNEYADDLPEPTERRRPQRAIASRNPYG